MLMNVENGEWKVDLIQNIFLEHEVDSILSIPLSTTLLVKNKLVWTVTANRKFSVKSAYHLARVGNTRYGGENTDSLNMKRFWKKIWKAQVQG